ncbi:Uncharacterised protein [Vibrio cholerae]|nr:Uncharacterised protein [Vibrio cholerae]
MRGEERLGCWQKSGSPQRVSRNVSAVAGWRTLLPSQSELSADKPH